MAGRTEFIGGFVLGALVGVGLGILLAPQPGEAVRHRIKERANELGSRVKGAAENALHRGRQVVEKGVERVREAVERGKEAAQEKREELLDRLEELEDR